MNRTPPASVCLLAVMAMGACLLAASARADDKLLEETVEFTGEVLFLQSRVPALVIGAVRDGRAYVACAVDHRAVDGADVGRPGDKSERYRLYQFSK